LKSALKFHSARIRIAEYFETSADAMLQAARKQGLEGVVAKRKESRYEAGKRSGAWSKYRLNRGQELVIGGYFPSAHGVESIIVGYYKESMLIYVKECETDLFRRHEDKYSRGSARWLCRIVLSRIFLKSTKAVGATV